MPPRHISAGVRRFIAQHIRSVTQLELLLLLHRDPGSAWSAEEAAREMRFPTAWAELHLERFVSAGFVMECRQPADRVRYRSARDHAALLDEVAEIYRLRRTSVMTLIFSPAEDPLRLLSDAFRIRRDEED